MAKKKKKSKGGGAPKIRQQGVTRRPDQRIGEPETWSVRTLLNAYVEAKQQELDDLAEKYGALLRARGHKTPRVVNQNIMIGATYGKKKGDTMASREVFSHKMVEVFNPLVPDESKRSLGIYHAWGLEYDFSAMVKQYGSDHEWISGSRCQIVKVPLDEGCLETVELVESYGYNASKKKPLMCVYDAVKDYLRVVHGVYLDNLDEDFFIAHPLVQTDGVPFPDTLRVVQELIGVWGFRISRVQLAPEYNVKGDILQWRGVLGCNPLAFTDRLTTNAQFKEQMVADGVPDANIDVSQFRFEYSEVGLRPAIACGVIGEVAGVTGSTGGHATFKRPRSSMYDPLLSFQIERAAFTTWKKNPKFDSVPEKPALKAEALDVFDMSAWYSKHHDQKKYIDEPATKKLGFLDSMLGTKQTVTSAPPPRAVTYDPAAPFDPFECQRCNTPRHLQQRSTFSVPGLCDDCWMSLVENAICNSKACKRSHTQLLLRYKGFDWAKQTIITTCPACHQNWTIPRSFENGKFSALIQSMLVALHNYETDMEIEKQIASFAPAKKPAETEDPGDKPEETTKPPAADDTPIIH